MTEPTNRVGMTAPRMTERALGLLALGASGAGVAGLIVPWGLVALGLVPLVAALLLAAAADMPGQRRRLDRTTLTLCLAAAAVLAAATVLIGIPMRGMATGVWLATAGLWLAAWLVVERMLPRTRPPGRAVQVLAPAAFGITLLGLWEIIVLAGRVPEVILPAPSDIGARFAQSTDILWTDFQQTFLGGVLAGYAIGCAAGFLIAIAIDRSPFLKRGLLPIGNLFSALPIIGIAPIMVMWFGFGWESKAAVVVAMTFFPMLVNTVAGLAAADRASRDLMRTYASGYGASLRRLYLPAAMPFVFNALKINSTLALIGAIVAEFFGSPTEGMGFRISTEAGRMNLDMVWAEITVAAIAGVAFYGLVAGIERLVTFWHPSMRRA